MPPATGGHWGSGVKILQPPKARGSVLGVEAPSVGQFLQISIKITHFMHISAKILLF